ncbi:hypothetical protein CCP4SC76_3060025 [Gammaproteobacteria bacterium]
MTLERLAWEQLQKVLAESDGNISATARALRMHRRTIVLGLNHEPIVVPLFCRHSLVWYGIEACSSR